MRKFEQDGLQRGFQIILETGSEGVHQEFFVDEFEVDQGMLWFKNCGNQIALNTSRVRSIHRVPHG